MASESSYLDIPTMDPEQSRVSVEAANLRAAVHRSPSPSPRIPRKKTPSHQGQAGIGSSVINLANTILGMSLDLAER
jgi:hypothetical protein